MMLRAHDATGARSMTPLVQRGYKSTGVSVYDATSTTGIMLLARGTGLYNPKSNTRKRIPGTNCTEIVVSCTGFRAVGHLAIHSCPRTLPATGITIRPPSVPETSLVPPYALISTRNFVASA
eukprot:2253024-Rhodomonas_salina.2